jgi:hypothetical protein
MPPARRISQAEDRRTHRRCYFGATVSFKSKEVLSAYSSGFADDRGPPRPRNIASRNLAASLEKHAKCRVFPLLHDLWANGSLRILVAASFKLAVEDMSHTTCSPIHNSMRTTFVGFCGLLKIGLWGEDQRRKLFSDKTRRNFC